MNWVNQLTFDIFFSIFFGEEKFSWLALAEENLHFQGHTNFSSQISVFSSATLVLEGRQLIFFFTKKIRQMKAGQTNKYDNTKT